MQPIANPRILLVYPPNLLMPSFAKKAVLPLGIAYLAAVLKMKGVHTEVLDCTIEGIENDFEFNDTRYYGLSIDSIRSHIERGRYDVVGISCQFSALKEISLKICEIAKSCGVTHVLAGGLHVSAQPESILSSSAVNYIFCGEAEESLAEFVDAIRSGDEAAVKRIDGIGYREGDRLCTPSETRFVQDIDSIPFPARELFHVEKYFDRSSPMGGVFKSPRNMTLIASRGCPARCSFCASSRFVGRFRMRSQDKILEEIRNIQSAFGVEEVQFQDDNLTLDKNKAMDLFRALKESGLRMPWSVPSGLALWALDDELIDAMAVSGCHYAAVAIESGNQRVLREVINKPLDLERVPHLCASFRKAKIKLSAFFVIGFPGETLKEIEETFDFASKCNLDNANFFYAAPLPGSPLWDEAVRGHFFVEGFSLKKINYSQPSLKSDHWTVEELVTLVQRRKWRFYFQTFLKHPGLLAFRIFEMLKKEPKRLNTIIQNQLFPPKTASRSIGKAL